MCEQKFTIDMKIHLSNLLILTFLEFVQQFLDPL
ncbi:uncharacterized protein METZ01_LOCUS344304 [marine metagenome]|uniref:Uncharacterized protein n=1 Tax=marine metagenome TaxID=408172 RepID=A0A382R2M6_9ZZZZ